MLLLSAPVKSLTGMLTRPKVIVPFQIDRGATAPPYPFSRRPSRERRWPDPEEDAAVDPTIEDQLTKYLTDVHSIEVQAIAQLERAPEIAGDDRLAAAFSEHLEETREHERLGRGEAEGGGAGAP